jgi:hypothetical protein
MGRSSYRYSTPRDSGACARLPPCESVVSTRLGLNMYVCRIKLKCSSHTLLIRGRSLKVVTCQHDMDPRLRTTTILIFVHCKSYNYLLSSLVADVLY